VTGVAEPGLFGGVFALDPAGYLVAAGEFVDAALAARRAAAG
jgi:hypothetical protein